MVTTVTVRYFDGCPNWQDAVHLVRSVLDAAGLSRVPVGLEAVETASDAQRLAFIGSRTILIDSRDPFDPGGAPVGLAWRVYLTSAGLRGVPSRSDLESALTDSWHDEGGTLPRAADIAVDKAGTGSPGEPTAERGQCPPMPVIREVNVDPPSVDSSTVPATSTATRAPSAATAAG